MDAQFSASAETLGQSLIRSIAIRRNDSGYFPTRFFATCSPFLCQVSQRILSHFVGFSPPARPPRYFRVADYTLRTHLGLSGLDRSTQADLNEAAAAADAFACG